MPLVTISCTCVADVMSPLAVAMAFLFALHLLSYVKCGPPQLGHRARLCIHALPPVCPHVATSHMCRNVLCSPAHIVYLGTRSWHWKSVCPHLLQLPYRASALSGIKVSALNLLLLTQISCNSPLPASLLGTLKMTDALPAGNLFCPQMLSITPFGLIHLMEKGGICTPSFSASISSLSRLIPSSSRYCLIGC